ncbi:MAG: hypothetical protein Q9181_007460 [Wetmoreana brouardii]
MWLIDLAKELPPTVHFDAFDDDFSMAPPVEWLPSNVTLRLVNNFHGGISEAYHGRYDMVKVADMVTDWNEVDTAHRRILKSESALPSPKLEALLEHVVEQETNAIGPRGWIDSLFDILIRYGLEVESLQYRFRMPRAYSQAHSDHEFVALKDFSYMLDMLDEFEGSTLRKLLAEAQEECEENRQAIVADMVVVVGKKVADNVVGGLSD